eukprot:gnl/TRDRNA2_/TRDRNA2_188343_c0_seq1.p1 gnl/TRDRNA2_/TRDRNA2_188343_c0~~gnl/TRDRNA2_/TRDRNA2_188343_c0_seq1.p1  ORF type:complete len:619 (-),score=134.01 gnl/TRDRNA2_/TRDRNA2_188343_c0_seq1:127-1809(-)
MERSRLMQMQSMPTVAGYPVYPTAAPSDITTAPAAAISPAPTDTLQGRWSVLGSTRGIAKSPSLRHTVQEMAQMGQPSQKLRELFTSVEASEAWVEVLQDRNTRLRFNCLQTMRSNALLQLMRAGFNEWVAHCTVERRDRAIDDMKKRLLERFLPIFARFFGSSPQVLRKSCFQGWNRIKNQLQEENKILDELDAHRRGRGQLIQQYRELEQELLAERQQSQEAHARLQESSLELEHMQQELAKTSGLQQRLERELEDAKERVRVLTEHLKQSQERCSGVKQELMKETEKSKRYKQQIEDEEDEKQELRKKIVNVENALESVRVEAAMKGTNGDQYEAMIKERDEQILTYEAQLTQARAVIESLSRGATDFLRMGGPAGSPYGGGFANRSQRRSGDSPLPSPSPSPMRPTQQLPPSIGMTPDTAARRGSPMLPAGIVDVASTSSYSMMIAQKEAQFSQQPRMDDARQRLPADYEASNGEPQYEPPPTSSYSQGGGGWREQRVANGELPTGSYDNSESGRRFTNSAGYGEDLPPRRPVSSSYEASSYDLYARSPTPDSRYR